MKLAVKLVTHSFGSYLPVLYMVTRLLELLSVIFLYVGSVGYSVTLVLVLWVSLLGFNKLFFPSSPGFDPDSHDVPRSISHCSVVIFMGSPFDLIQEKNSSMEF